MGPDRHPCGHGTEQRVRRRTRHGRHPNFFQFEGHVKAHAPRVDGGPGAKVHPVVVPRSRPHGGFTPPMESVLRVLAQSGRTLAGAARVIGRNPRRGATA